MEEPKASKPSHYIQWNNSDVLRLVMILKQRVCITEHGLYRMTHAAPCII